MELKFETVRLDRADGVATLTLNRPDRLNSFTVQMHGEVRAALMRIDADRTMRCLVLTGAGRGFCAGQDLADRAVAPGGDSLDLGDSIENFYKPLVLRLRSFRMPTSLPRSTASRRAPAPTSRWPATSCSRPGRRASSSRSRRSGWCPIAAAPGGCRAWSDPRVRWAWRCSARSSAPSRPRSGA
jgi:hypothetical protein